MLAFLRTGPPKYSCTIISTKNTTNSVVKIAATLGPSSRRVRVFQAFRAPILFHKRSFRDVFSIDKKHPATFAICMFNFDEVLSEFREFQNFVFQKKWKIVEIIICRNVCQILHVLHVSQTFLQVIHLRKRVISFKHKTCMLLFFLGVIYGERKSPCGSVSL